MRPSKVTLSKNGGLLPDEQGSIYQEIAILIADPAKWLDMPNDQLGSEKPRNLIGTPQEQFVWDLLRSIKHGMPT